MHIRNFNWASTAIGPISSWTNTLRIAVNIMLQSSVPHAIFWGKDGILLYNDAYIDIAGAKQPSMLGKKAIDAWPEISDFTKNILTKCFKGKTLTFRNQAFSILRNNKLENVWLNVDYSTIYDEFGKPVGVWKIVVDETDQVVADKELKRFKFMVDNANDAFILTRRNGTFAYLNDLSLKRWGYTQKESTLLNVSDVDAMYEKQQFEHVFALAQTQKVPSYETLHKRKNGSTFPVEVSITGITLQNKPYMLSIAREISERKTAEKELYQVQQQLKQALSVGLIGAWTLDTKTSLVYASESLAKLFGIDPKQAALGLNLKVFSKSMHPDDRDFVTASIYKAIKSGKQYEIDYRVTDADGEQRWVLARGQSEKSENGMSHRFTGVLIDITERKKAEKALSESEGRMRFLADSMPQQVWTSRPDGKLDYVNRQVRDYFQKPEQAIINDGWQKELHPNDLKKTLDTWIHSLKTGDIYEAEFRLRRAADETYRWHLARALPISNEKGKIIKWFGSNTDIEELKSMIKRSVELEKITSSLKDQSAQLMALNTAKDDFISLASHQLRTPATGVKQYVGMLLDGYAGRITAKHKTFLEQAYQSNERQITVINDLLKVAQLDAGKVSLRKEKINLTSLLGNIINEQATKFIDREQDILYDPPKSSRQVMADPTKLRMALENIIDNASKYTPAHKTIEVKILKTKNKINIVVKDQGVGIAKKDINKLFQKFSRLDNPLSVSVGGSGLGLYLVKKIIDLHDGSIDVDSKVNKGTTLTITLPA